jgi:hypothetical protein
MSLFERIRPSVVPHKKRAALLRAETKNGDDVMTIVTESV